MSDENEVQIKEKPVCGIVMPISAIDNCPASHWTDVLSILIDAIEEAGFKGNLVSNGEDSGIIQKRIIENLYDNPIVVCDVSGKNPNVMFELGMRLAFDKPTIIVKDDKTSYSFDTSPIEHLDYPRDLRFSSIVAFKQKLVEKIKATHDKATNDESYTTFLKHFGPFTVAKLEKKEVSSQEFIIDELSSIRSAISRLENSSNTARIKAALAPATAKRTVINIPINTTSEERLRDYLRFISTLGGVISVAVAEAKFGKFMSIEVSPPDMADQLKDFISKKIKNWEEE